EIAAPRVWERRVGLLFAGTGLVLFGLMGVLGLVMRLTQATVLDVGPDWFYRLMTLHGAGMLVGVLLAMMGAAWYALRGTVPLGLERMLVSYALIVLGAVLAVVATLVGGFATGWTFLPPLPFYPAGQWHTWATATWLVAMLLVGTGFFVFCADLLATTTGAYGGLSRTLGIPFLRGKEETAPPPQAIALTVVAIDGLLASAVGATIVLGLLTRTYDSKVAFDVLWAKNFVYYFGHEVMNLVIYLAAAAVYVILPRYAGRPWKTTKAIVGGWLTSLVFLVTAYSHHLYMDFAQPLWWQVVAEISSYGAGIPVAVVTIYTGTMLVFGSRYRWTLASSLLYLGFAGWAIGGTGAVIDSLIPVNFRFHNTLWVVAHFHTYMLLCVVFWALAFVAHLLEQASGQTAEPRRTRRALVLMLVGGYGLTGTWFLEGVLGVPRRYQLQPTGTAGYSLAASIFVMLFALGFLACCVELVRLARAWRSPWVEAETVSAWSGARFPTRRRLHPEPPPPEEPLPARHPVGLPLQTGMHVALAVAACVVGLLAYFPQVIDASEANTRWHHLDHASQFLLGGLVALVVGCLPAVSRRLGERPGLGLAAVLAGSTAMLLLMAPRFYEPLERHSLLHALYHVLMAVLGFVAGLGATRLGTVVGRLAFVLTVLMTFWFAGGMTGG
ncbi:MAG TPA: cbb3-type cytochrome c oxidase subunit I, partial [Gaiellaceae bacterium]|nr:cbb3-type cytochrome c oxidase subunit I [Gaiellaceae bacterium]